MRKPKFGQNFLVDNAARHRIADALGNIGESSVIEIGPGHGSLTSILAGRARRLVCIEIDPSLARELRFHFRNHTNVEIVEADILETNLTTLLGERKQASVIGNLPYYITSDILLHLFTYSDRLKLAVLMMQREVADRVAAQPGTREYGLLSCTAQMQGDTESLFTLPPEAFSPAPEVYSTVLRMAFAPRFHQLGISDRAGFTQFLKFCFQQKRKTLGNNLRAAGWQPDRIEAACAAAGATPGTRAEALPLRQLAGIFLHLAPQNQPCSS